MTNPTNRPDQGNDVRPAALAGLGFQFAAALLAFGYAGLWLDRQFDSAPICLMIGIFFGGGGTFYLSYKRLTAPRPPR